MIENNITAIIIALAALLALALALAAYLFLRVRRIEAECDLLTRGTHGKNFIEIVNDNIDQVHGLLEEVDTLSGQYAGVLRRMAGSVQHVGVVRYDAFRDMGGMMSFSVALLDDRGNGITLSSIYGRSESRSYAKPVVERGSTYELSPEEREAIRLAMQSKEYGALPVVARDREHEERLANLRLFHERELESAGGPEPEPYPPQRRERLRAEDRQEPARREALEDSAGEAAGGRSSRRSRGEGGEKPRERTGTRAPERLWKDRDRPGARRPAGGEDGARGGGTAAGGAGSAEEPEPPRILGGEELLSGEYTQKGGRAERTGGGSARSRPRGLNTPVERLRDRDEDRSPGGE